MALDKDYNLIVGLRIREVRESMHLSREKFSEICDISAPTALSAFSVLESVTPASIIISVPSPHT